MNGLSLKSRRLPSGQIEPLGERPDFGLAAAEQTVAKPPSPANANPGSYVRLREVT